MTIRMIVFDIAGTVVSDSDNAVAARICDALRAAGHDVTEELVNPIMGMQKPSMIGTLIRQVTGQPPSSEEIDLIHSDYQQRIIAHYESAPQVTAMDGAEELFKILRKNQIRITLDTGFDRLTTDAILRRMGWDKGVIDDSIASDEVENGRPAPDMIHHLMERAAINDPATVAKAGDSMSDIEQGLNTGCGVVIAVRGERTEGILKRYPAIPVVERLLEIPGILGLSE